MNNKFKVGDLVVVKMDKLNIFQRKEIEELDKKLFEILEVVFHGEGQTNMYDIDRGISHYIYEYQLEFANLELGEI